MAAPTTPFEDDGVSLTPLAHETAFWQQVAADTAATVTVAGTSTAGRDIHRIDLGDGHDQTLFITSLIHGNEPASREALMLWLRDLAYSTDPADLAYLTDHRIVALVPCNPDGFEANTRSVPGAGDPNRDMYGLTIKEARVVMWQHAQVRPHATLDIHEFLPGGGHPAQYWGFPGGNSIVAPGIQQAAQDWFDQTLADVISAGYPNSDYYPSDLIGRGMFSTMGGMIHSVTLLNETNAYGTNGLAERVAIQRVGLDAAIAWHAANAARCTKVVEESRELARSNTYPIPLWTTQYFAEEPDPQMIHVSGYQLAPGQVIPPEHGAIHAIQVQADGFVPMQQEAQWVLPTLLDPDSPDKIVDASRVAARPRQRQPISMQVQTAEGGRREVIDMFLNVGGEQHRVTT